MIFISQNCSISIDSNVNSSSINVSERQKRLRGVYNSSNPFIANRGGGERGLADSKLPKSKKVLQNILQNLAQAAHPKLLNLKIGE